MPRVSTSAPRVDVRSYTGKDGRRREYPGVRYYDADGVCRRRTCASVAEAEFERARMVLAGEAGRPAKADGSATLEAFWEVWLPDARGRLAEGTVADYEYLWNRRVRPRFGDVAMRDITPRSVSQWKASMGQEGVGRETIRKSMILMQAMLTVAIEWGDLLGAAALLAVGDRAGLRRGAVGASARARRPRVGRLGAASRGEGARSSSCSSSGPGRLSSQSRLAVLAAVFALLVYGLVSASSRQVKRTFLVLIVGGLIVYGAISVLFEQSGSRSTDRFSTITPGRLTETVQEDRGSSLALIPKYASDYRQPNVPGDGGRRSASRALHSAT